MEREVGRVISGRWGIAASFPQVTSGLLVLSNFSSVNTHSNKSVSVFLMLVPGVLIYIRMHLPSQPATCDGSFRIPCPWPTTSSLYLSTTQLPPEAKGLMWHQTHSEGVRG